MLTKRQKEIVSILVNMDEPALIKDLAEKFSVTPRTIKSDIKTIKSWLQDHNIILHSQPNKGVWLVIKNEKEKFQIHQNLLMVPVDEDIWGVEGRIKRIILILILHPTEYITADMLANNLSVSKKTIYFDIKKVEAYLEKNDVYLSTTPRKGYSIAGREIDIRQFTEYILTQKIVDEELLEGEELEKLYAYLSSLSTDIMKAVTRIDEIIKEIDYESHAYQPTSTELLTLFVRLIISICRNGKGRHLYMKREIANSSNLLSGFASLAHFAMEKVFSKFKLTFSNEEFIYIYRSSLLDSKQDNIIELTNNIIDFVSNRLSIPFYKDSVLQTNLLSHLSNKFTEENALLLKRNPFMEDLKTNHQYLYEPVKEAYERYMVSSHNVSSEIISSFITLHFLVSLETTFFENKPLKALYVCATGRGVARVVKNRVEREVPQLRVVQYCGLDDLDHVLQEQHFDLVISVFPIDIDRPTVWVDAVPTKRNIEEVKGIVRDLTGNEVNSFVPSSFVQDFAHANDAESASREVIMTAMEIYHSLKEAFENRIKLSLEDAFLMHVFLMVHRVKFSQEYDHLVNNSVTITSDFVIVDKVFKKHHFHASVDEKEAILFYIEKENDQ